MQTTSETPKVRKRRFGDRKDGRKVRTLQPIQRMMPYIMKKRSDAQNTFSDSFDITEADRIVRTKVKEGKTNFSLLHIILAAYIHMLAQRPGVNRFVSGQKIYARNNIEIVMAVKRELSLSGQETMIKVVFPPDATLHAEGRLRKWPDVWEIITEPNTVDNYGNPCRHARCPYCGFTWTSLYHVKMYFKHCPNCGQKLKYPE